MIRIQLFVPHNNFVGPATYNRLFTMHGTTMVFLVGMPILFGFGNYLVPLMIGARDMAFPRLNAFSFWISAFAGLLLYYSFIGGVGLSGTGTAPDVGWFAYAPLTERAFSPGHTMDYWAIGDLRQWDWQHRHRDQYHRHRVLHALQGHDSFRMPLLPWLYAYGLVSRAGGGEPADCCPGDADDRSLSWRSLLRHAGRRLRGAVGALLLDLRAPGGIRSGPSGICLCQRDHSGVLAQSHFRLSGHGGRHRWASGSSALACGRITCSQSA